MFYNFLKPTIRNLWSNKSFSIINIMGLALGVTCSLLIKLWIKDEYSVDAFHKKSSQLYSVYERQNHDGQWYAFHGTPAYPGGCL